MGEDEWAIVQIARYGRDGMLPEPGGVADQAAIIVAAVEIVLATWAKMEAARWERERPGE